MTRWPHVLVALSVPKVDAHVGHELEVSNVDREVMAA